MFQTKKFVFKNTHTHIFKIVYVNISDLKSSNRILNQVLNFIDFHSKNSN